MSLQRLAIPTLGRDGPFSFDADDTLAGEGIPNFSIGFVYRKPDESDRRWACASGPPRSQFHVVVTALAGTTLRGRFDGECTQADASAERLKIHAAFSFE
jgi:hypothetical protein